MTRDGEHDARQPAGEDHESGLTQVHLTDPQALRAYAHPTRMRLVGLLRLHGPLTATRAAELTGQSVASCSYHLRMLAKYGLVEEDPGGSGRQKPWRATARSTSWPEYSEDPAVTEASGALTAMAAENWFERTMRAIESRGALPREWQEAEEFSDTAVYLTPAELKELRDRIRDLIAAYVDRDDPALRPEGAKLVEFVRVAYVHPQDRHSDEEMP
ncbi:winged helix-turn-helix domain-containing protein [Streptomyces marincola]|uniref:Transcriptional regulator n=1 Tax=Streptomyces marincola TaxID=2878388 RepID=A0A1W7D1G2_9ACTN|nr:helix-turn-helix domain-containing protein [Streptomyces marincola]ARQ70845.1 transcriptional regulator [Streptomyces marincola]